MKKVCMLKRLLQKEKSFAILRLMIGVMRGNKLENIPRKNTSLRMSKVYTNSVSKNQI